MPSEREGAGDAPVMLAGDAEREHAIGLLQDAVVVGRLTLTEFGDRVGNAQVARTDRDLQALVVDLPPVPAVSAAVAPMVQRAIFSRLERRGPWNIPVRSSWRSIFGTVVLDLRQARLAGPDSELVISNVFGTVTVVVPDGVAVEVTGGGMFASQVIDTPALPPPAGAPTLRIRASGPGGTLYVRSS